MAGMSDWKNSCLNSAGRQRCENIPVMWANVSTTAKKTNSWWHKISHSHMPSSVWLMTAGLGACSLWRWQSPVLVLHTICQSAWFGNCTVRYCYGWDYVRVMVTVTCCSCILVFSNSLSLAASCALFTLSVSSFSCRSFTSAFRPSISCCWCRDSIWALIDVDIAAMSTELIYSNTTLHTFMQHCTRH